MRNKTFVTIFSRLKNVDLIKPPGMILYYVSKLTNNNIKCSLVTLNNDNYEYYSSYRENYNLIILDNGKNRKSPYRQVFSYLRKEAVDIDVLSLYHFDIESLFYAIVYKHYNRNGKLLLQMDADERIKEFFQPAERKGLMRITNNLRPIKSVVMKGLLKKSDYIGIESKSLYNYLMNKGNRYFEQKLFINPYGFNVEEFKRYQNPEIKKENIVLTIGRIGDYQKNNEMLINAIKEINDLKGWKFIFAGPVEKSFEQRIKDLYENHPELKESVIFTGEIKDRKKLFEYMQSVKVFCLSSRYESFGIVLVEAAYNNCYILSTDVGCASDVIQNMACGTLFKDEEELTNKLKSIIEGSTNVEYNERLTKDEYVNMNNWENIVSELFKVINLQ